MKKKSIPILLAGALIINTGLSYQVSANAKELDNNLLSSQTFANTKELDNNLNIISESPENFIYTYTQDCNEFKVIERVNKDRTYVYSEIYKMYDNEYKLDSTSEFKIDMDTNKYTYELSNSNGQIISKESESLSNIVRVENENKANTRAWYYVNTVYTNGKVASYTIQIALTALGAAIGSATGVPSNVVVGGAVALEIAKIIVNERIPHIYQKIMYYVQRNTAGYIEQQQWITSTYKDSSYTQKKGNNIVNTYNINTGKWSSN